MVDEPCRLELFDEVPAKILNADIAVMALSCRQIHAVKGHVAPWLNDAVKLLYEIAEVLRELPVAARVPHIAFAGRVGIERGEWRGKYAVANMIIWNRFQPFDTIAKNQGPSPPFTAFCLIFIRRADAAFQVLFG